MNPRRCNPENIYGITKTMGIHCCRHFRRELGVFAATGILFNHESHLRPAKFLSQKIVRGVLAFQKDKTKKLVLGDLNAAVDWGYAGDYVEAMTRILGHARAGGFCRGHRRAAHGRGIFADRLRNCRRGLARMRRDRRPLLKKKPVRLVGDSGKLRRLTGWQPRVSFRQMIELMLQSARVEADSLAG